MTNDNVPPEKSAFNEKVTQAAQPRIRKIGDTIANLAAGAASANLLGAFEKVGRPTISTEKDIIKEFTFNIPTPEEKNQYQSAAVLMKALAEEATIWKKTVPPTHAPAVVAVLYGGIQINVDSLEQVSFHGIKISGTSDGAACTVLAHQTTVQMLCIAYEITPETPKRQIGFIIGDEKFSV